MKKKRSSTGKILLMIGGFLALILVVGFGLRAAGVVGGEEAGTVVETSKASTRTITQIVSSSGKIQPEIEVVIRPDVSGEIIELAVREGDFVRSGDLLVRIKPDLYQARIDELNAGLLTQKARYEQTRAGLIQAESVHKQNEELYGKKLISESEYIQTKSNWEAQKASLRAAEFQIQSAQAQLRRAEEELQQTVIRAPQDGTVTGLAVESGERVLGNSQMAGTEMMRISVLDKMEVLVEVNENDIVNIGLADTARIEVDAYPERLFDGIVTEVANSARITGSGSNEQVTNYQVKVRILTPHNLAAAGGTMVKNISTENVDENFVPSFKPGMSASVDVETQTATNVVSVPIQAVTVRDFAKDTKPSTTNKGEAGNEDEAIVMNASDNLNQDNLSVNKEDIRKVVFVMVDGKAVRKEVKTGISDNTHIQILTGIEAGEEVIIGSYRVLSRVLKDGDKVKVENISANFFYK